MRRLRRYLADNELSQAQFAELLGVSQPTVCDWLNGDKLPSTDNLISLSRITGISIDELLAKSGRQQLRA